MRQYIQESDFDARLKRIGDLYEGGKDRINSISRLHMDREDANALDGLYEIIRELRDIAATSLRANYEVKSN